MMGNNKFIIRPNQEQAISKIQAMLEGLDPDDSLMVIQIKERSDNKLEVTSANTIHSKHLPQIKSAFDLAFERVFADLAEQYPMLAAKTLMEMMKNEKD